MDDNNLLDEQTIVEGTVVSETVETPTETVTVTETTSSTGTAADSLITVTNLINNYLQQLERDQKELSAHKQMLEDSFGNDATYVEHDKLAKEAIKVRNATKAQIMKQPALMELSTKVKDLREDMKSTKEALSEYLQEYARLTGLRTIEGPNGDLQEIIYMAKLVKSQQKRDK